MKLTTLVIGLMALLAIAVSCNINKYDDIPKPAAATTNLNVVDTGTDTLKFYLNGTVQNTNGFIVPGGLTGYLSVPVGAQNYQFKRTSEFTYLFSVPLNLADTSYTSLVVAGSTTDKVFELADTLSDTTKSYAKIRFVHSAAKAAAVDVAIGNNLSFKNRTFKSVTPYTYITPGTKTVTVSLAGTTANLVSNVTLTLGPGIVYTLYIKGTPNGTGNNTFGTVLQTANINY